jgi:hypothetical protein
MTRDLPRLLAIPAVKCRLAAAGLLFRKMNLISEPLEHVDYSHPHFGEQLVNDAGDK